MEAWTIIAGVLAGSVLLAAMSWKWCLPPRMTGAIIFAGAVVGAVAGWLIQSKGFSPLPVVIAVIGVQVAVYTGIILYRFYRDPERTQPSDPHAVVSPADGTIIYIRKLAPGSVLRCDKKARSFISTNSNRPRW